MYSFLSRINSDSFIPDIDFLVSSQNLPKIDLDLFIEFHIKHAVSNTLFIPFIDTYDFDEFISIIKKYSYEYIFYVLFNESYIYKRKRFSLDLYTNLDNIYFGLQNCYISPNLLKILSTSDFSILIFNKFIFYNLHNYRNRIKLISGLIDFAYQLNIKICVPEIIKSKDIHYVHALHIDFYSRL